MSAPARIPETDAEIVAAAGGVALLIGGPSAERAVSLKSGAAVVAALQRAGVDAWGVDWQGDLMGLLAARRPDRVFIALHGRGGEDGQVQGALQIAGIPYTGSGVLGCALSMDKIRSKWIWSNLGLPTPDFVVLEAGDAVDAARLVERLGLPLVVKPSREGSSIGVSKVERMEEVAGAIAHARRFDTQVLAERWITGGEYTLSIVDGVSLPMIKLETPHAFYDYEAKYLADTTRYLCPCGLPEVVEHATADVARRAEPGDAIIVHPGYMITTLEYYEQREPALRQYPAVTIPTFKVKWLTRELMVQQVRDQARSARRFWLVESPDRVPAEDPDDTLVSWLSSTGTVLYQHDVTGVRITLVEMPPGW